MAILTRTRVPWYIINKMIEAEFDTTVDLADRHLTVEAARTNAAMDYDFDGKCYTDEQRLKFEMRIGHAVEQAQLTKTTELTKATDIKDMGTANCSAADRKLLEDIYEQNTGKKPKMKDQ